MLPLIVFPFHDTDGLMFSHLESITPQLKQHFANAYISISPLTEQTQQQWIEQLQADVFFSLNFNEPETPVGDHFMAGYRNAARHCPPEHPIHLCTVDRVAYALQTHHQAQFLADIRAASDASQPTLFIRSEAAWKTHPQNYYEIEGIGTRVGELVLGQSLDFFWCHLVAHGALLRRILPAVRRHDFRILAEIVLLLRDELQTKPVDWLAWEDPFIFARDADQFKLEREQSTQENVKRLNYVLPVLQLLLKLAEKKLIHTIETVGLQVEVCINLLLMSSSTEA